MNNTMYITGDNGFKAVILAKLGGTWIHGFKNHEENMLEFSMPENVLLEDFKSTIGYNNIVAYHLRFLDKPLEDAFSEIPEKFVPGKPFKMSIWANKDFKVRDE